MLTPSVADKPLPAYSYFRLFPTNPVFISTYCKVKHDKMKVKCDGDRVSRRCSGTKKKNCGFVETLLSYHKNENFLQQ